MLPETAIRIGIFGGSFDPVHLGHLALAEACQEQAKLDYVLFIPASMQPFKPEGPVASAEDRLRMLQLALKGLPTMGITEIELNREGPSYTVDSLRDLHKMYPNRLFFLLMGADSLADLPKWHEATEICKRSTPLVVARPGSTVNFSVLSPLISQERIAEIKKQSIEMKPIAISSTDIRLLTANDNPLRDVVPDAVASYIQAKKLYQSSD